MSSAFQFALKNVQASQWQPFENLASQFLADEFTSLRTLASPSGDLGRDAILHQPEGDSEVVIQYSVSADWESKIRRTIRQVSTEHPGVSVLIFVSPKQIAARADDLRTSARRESEMHLDIRDQHWFVERENRSDATSRAASWFTDLVVGDVLRDERLIDRSASVLTSEETRAALLYLVLQREDDDLDRHLTKLCYDALVRAVLRHSDSDNRKSRVQIHEEVCALLPTHDAATVTQYVDRALDRMNKRFTRHWVKTDEFCLTHEERERLASGIARFACWMTGSKKS